MTSALVEKESVLDSAVTRLQRYVAEQTVPGDRLPSEAELATNLGISRLTAREAIKVLAGRGLVDVSRGRRAAVRGPDSTVISDYLAVTIRRDARGLLELNDVRRALEVLSVECAAASATPAALEAIDAALDRMAVAARETTETGEASDGWDAYHRADLSFHSALALASGNRMLALILESLAECLRESFVASARGHLAHGGTVQDDLDAHQRIAEAIRRGSAIEAARLMRKHLEQSARDLRISVYDAGAIQADAATTREGARR